MKILLALVFAASLMACGGKAQKNTTPDNQTGTTEAPAGTGGATYGGAEAPAPEDPCAGM
jgi:hypothetical protein